MFRKGKQKVAIAVLVAAGATVAPPAASADTATPPLSAGGTQAFASLVSGGPRVTTPTTRLFQGPVTWAPVGSSFIMVCTITMSVMFNADGTTRVPTVSFSGCTTNVAGCSLAASASAGSLTPNGWGGRLVRDSSSVFRGRISAAYTQTMVGSTCPWQGAFPYTGVLSPRLTGGAPGVANATFDGAAAGTTSSAVGPVVYSGTLALEAGQPAIYFVP